MDADEPVTPSAPPVDGGAGCPSTPGYLEGSMAGLYCDRSAERLAGVFAGVGTTGALPAAACSCAIEGMKD